MRLYSSYHSTLSRKKSGGKPHVRQMVPYRKPGPVTPRPTQVSMLITTSNKQTLSLRHKDVSFVLVPAVPE